MSLIYRASLFRAFAGRDQNDYVATTRLYARETYELSYILLAWTGALAVRKISANVWIIFITAGEEHE